MKLALFDDFRLGLVQEEQILDITGAVHGHDSDPLGAGWWVRLCRDFPEVKSRIIAVARTAKAKPLTGVRLRPAVLNPGKIVAAASNYAAHVEELQARSEELKYIRENSATQGWMKDFGVFLKAPSSIIGNGDAVLLPPDRVDARVEIHHESELAVIVGSGGRDIPFSRALDHVFGYTCAVDVTIREGADRSFRNSFDTFTPIGPWVTTSDEIEDPHKLRIRLSVDGKLRQDVSTSDMATKVSGIIAFASTAMRLDPGDVILTGSPPGVGTIADGMTMRTWIDKIGAMENPVRLRGQGSTSSRWRGE